MHIGRNMQRNDNMNNQQLPTTDQQRDLGIIITKDLKCKNKQIKAVKTANRAQGFVGRNFRYKKRTDTPLIQITSPPTSRTFSTILVPTFKAHMIKYKKHRKDQQKMIPEIRNHSYHQRILDLDLEGSSPRWCNWLALWFVEHAVMLDCMGSDLDPSIKVSRPQCQSPSVIHTLPWSVS